MRIPSFHDSVLNKHITNKLNNCIWCKTNKNIQDLVIREGSIKGNNSQSYYVYCNTCKSCSKEYVRIQDVIDTLIKMYLLESKREEKLL